MVNECWGAMVYRTLQLTNSSFAFVEQHFVFISPLSTARLIEIELIYISCSIFLYYATGEIR